MACFVATGDVVVDGNAIFTGDGTFANVNPTTGINLPNGGSLLDHYSHKVTVPVTYTGALSGSANITASKIGSLCMIHIPVITGASLGNLSIVIAGLSASFRPSVSAINFEYTCLDNSVVSQGALTVDSATGNITLYASMALAAFSALGNCGMTSAIDLCYIA
jgi:hypothetical protein